jgi:serine/threonine protein kinase
MHHSALGAGAAGGETHVPQTSARTPRGSGETTEDFPKESRPAPNVREQIAHYRIVKKIGEGSMGVVYEAEDIPLERRVALKVMKADAAKKSAAKERFLREARTTAAIKHDNVVTIYQVGEERGSAYMAMELLQGTTLDAWLKKDKRLSWSQIVRIGRETARGLAAAHEKGLVHRDVKPANLWLEAPNGRVKILDFGLARPAKASFGITDFGVAVGTPMYMSPEQARGETVDHRSDLFSLGGVLYRLISGRPPFPGKSAMSVMVAVIHQDPQPIAELSAKTPPALAAIVMKLLAKDPADRPASASDAADALRRIERQLQAAKKKSK